MMRDAVTDVTSATRDRRRAGPRRTRGLYFNRELSWLDFNERVLQLAEDPAVPLLERVKFFAIYSSNLDEFFMVRVAGLHDQVDAGIDEAAAGRPHAGRDDRRDPRASCASTTSASARCLDRDLRPALAEHGIRIVGLRRRRPATSARALDERFRRQIFPVLTPLAVGLGRPFPYISNLSLSLGVIVRDPVTERRDVRAREGAEGDAAALRARSATGDDVRAARGADRRRTSTRCSRAWRSSTTRVFRVTRDADFDGLRRGRRPAAGGRGRAAPRAASARSCASRSSAGMSPAMREQLTARARGRAERRVYEVDGPARPQRPVADRQGLPGFASCATRRGRRSPSRGCSPTRTSSPTCSPRCASATSSLHHPYDSFVDARSSASSSRRSTTRTCSRSSRPCTARATTRRSSRR